MMDETKRCPYCGKEIMAAARKCRHCGTWLDSTTFAPPFPANKDRQGCEADFKRKEEGPMGFFQCYFEDIFIRHFADFSGKTSRKQFWWSFLCSLSAMLVLSYFCLLIFAIGVPPLAAIFLFLCITTALAIPQLSATIRRLRDAGKDWAWIFISFVPFIGGFWLLAILCQPGTTKCPKTHFKKIDWMIALGTFSVIAISVILLCTVGSGGQPLI